MQNIRIISTGDGSHTLYNEALNEHYHSVHGAVNESLHVFIQSGLQYRNLPQVNILEIGFGTGLNALLSYHYALKNGVSLQYHSLELYPLPELTLMKLNYPAVLGDTYKPLFEQLHAAAWDQPQSLHTQFLLHKLSTSIHDYQATTAFDVIYFDAFAPDKQPDMWDAAVFEKLFSLLSPGGVLVTYCAKGVVKRTLKAAGFIVEALPGPPFKREMVRASKFV